MNVLATASRYSKSASIFIRHFHCNFYKLGAEPRYTTPTTGDGRREVDGATLRTIHRLVSGTLAASYGTTLSSASVIAPRLRAFIKDTPRTLPPNIKFQNGSKWKFRTLGDNGEGIDGNSFYLISIDEAGWIRNLRRIMEGWRVYELQMFVDELISTARSSLESLMTSTLRQPGVCLYWA